ncbi:MAG: YcaO-like family protein [Stappiaceae bacterium]
MIHDHVTACEAVRSWVKHPAARSEPSHRFTPMTYWTRLKPILSRFSITRVADITGLDRIGIPVVQAVRPPALSNAVSQGKGGSLEEAAIGAVLEAVETASAETVPWKNLSHGSAREIFGENSNVDFSHHLHPDIEKASWLDEILTWSTGISLTTGAEHLIPSALVHTDFIPSSPHAKHPFRRSTTGLGAGPTLFHAILHSMQEIIERKATGDAEMTHGFFERKRFDPIPHSSEMTKQLLKTLNTLSILSGVYLCPSASKTYSVWAQLLDGTDSPLGLPLPADGFACRSTIQSAIHAALMEAVQTRASVIAASRDDLTRTFYPRYPDNDLLAFERHRFAQDPPPSSDLPEIPVEEPGPDTWFDILSHGFAETQFTPICVPLLSDERCPLHVVRILDVGNTNPAGCQA